MSKVQSLITVLEDDPEPSDHIPDLSNKEYQFNNESDGFATKVEVESHNRPSSLSADTYLQHNQKVMIKWSATPEMKSWGIANIYPHVPDQSIEVIFEESTEGDDKHHPVKVDLKDVKTEIESGEEITSLQFAPIRLELDFQSNKHVLVFQVS